MTDNITRMEPAASPNHCQPRVSPIEVVQAPLDRINEVNPKVNAIFALADDAAEAAKKTEAAESRANVGPLPGVPFNGQETDRRGWCADARGTPISKGRVAHAHANVVARLKAGGIVIAKTNTPEFSYSVETDNRLTDRTNNSGISTTLQADRAAESPPRSLRAGLRSGSSTLSVTQFLLRG
jgi:aspartyl-tRNA(Asn)/glutamyl-tRNA(Gln) amidotransferase subunit A